MSTNYGYSIDNGVLRITEKGKTIKELKAVPGEYVYTVTDIGVHDSIYDTMLSPIKGTPFTESIRLIIAQQSEGLIDGVVGIVKRSFSTNPFDTTYNKEKYNAIIMRYRKGEEFAIFDETARWQPGVICVKPAEDDARFLLAAVNYEVQKYGKQQELLELSKDFKVALEAFKKRPLRKEISSTADQKKVLVRHMGNK